MRWTPGSITGLALLLAGCASTAPPAPPGPISGDPYRAYGTEPFWSVSIGPQEMRFEAPDRRATVVATPVARTTFNGRRYETSLMTVDITRQPCSDGMSDRQFGERVMVMIDGKTFDGCGGPPLPPGELAGTSWRIVSIGGEAVTAPRTPTTAFDDARISGSGGCNRYTGGYTVDGDRLMLSGVASTKMACVGAGSDTETRLFAALRGTLRLRYDAAGRMVLTRDDGTTILLQQME